MEKDAVQLFQGIEILAKGKFFLWYKPCFNHDKYHPARCGFVGTVHHSNDNVHWGNTGSPNSFFHLN